MAERWLRCEVRKGMFSDEALVLIKTSSGEMVSFSVPKELVADYDGRVRVRTFRQDQRSWVVVPNDTQSIVPVDETHLVDM